MSTFDNNERKLAYAESAIDGLRILVEQQKRQLADTMTPRDYFASAVVAAIIQNRGVQSPELIVETAYRVANIMMKERAGKD